MSFTDLETPVPFLPECLRNKVWVCGEDLLGSEDVARVLTHVAMNGHARGFFDLSKRQRDQAYRLLKREGLIESAGTRGYRLVSKES